MSKERALAVSANLRFVGGVEPEDRGDLGGVHTVAATHYLNVRHAQDALPSGRPPCFNEPPLGDELAEDILLVGLLQRPLGFDERCCLLAVFDEVGVRECEDIGKIGMCHEYTIHMLQAGVNLCAASGGRTTR